MDRRRALTLNCYFYCFLTNLRSKLYILCSNEIGRYWNCYVTIEIIFIMFHCSKNWINKIIHWMCHNHNKFRKKVDAIRMISQLIFSLQLQSAKICAALSSSSNRLTSAHTHNDEPSFIFRIRISLPMCETQRWLTTEKKYGSSVKILAFLYAIAARYTIFMYKNIKKLR